MLRRSSRRRRGGADRCMPKSGNSEPEDQLAEQKHQPAEGNPEAVHAESGSREPEGQLAERPSPKRKAEERTRPAATPNRCMPKSGNSEPEGQPAERQPRSGRRQNQPAQRQPRSGACRKAEAVSPKANRSAAISETEGGRTNPASGRPRNGRPSPKRSVAPSGENHPRRAIAIRRSKPRNEGSAEQCRHTYQYNRKTRL